MNKDFRFYTFQTLFAEGEISENTELIKNDLSDNQRLRAEQLLKNTALNYNEIVNKLSDNSLNWSFVRIAKIEKTILILGISELLLKLTPKKVIISEWTKMTDTHASSEGAKFVNAILDKIGNDYETIRKD